MSDTKERNRTSNRIEWHTLRWDLRVSAQQGRALELETELLHAPSASEDLLGAGLTVW
jgi:hypothetical protein